MKWYCVHCGWNANIETWITLIGEKWLCKHCGVNGYVNDENAPKFLNENEQGDLESDFNFVKRVWNFL